VSFADDGMIMAVKNIKTKIEELCRFFLALNKLKWRDSNLIVRRTLNRI
jgi:hypothetical protein